MEAVSASTLENCSAKQYGRVFEEHIGGKANPGA